ncbi:MAG: beta-ketoacyl synthase N-terminal-like domain-containing protein, partial [Steroidobacteraceae bacterium]
MTPRAAGNAPSIEELQRLLQRSLARILQSCSALPEPDSAFSALGLDSAGAVQWMQHINDELQTAFPVSRVYECPTVRQLAQFLASQLYLAEAAPGSAIRYAAETYRDSADTELADADAAAIAVIGMAGRFPGARNLRDFWRNIASGTDCISEVPPQRWSIERFFDTDASAPGKSYGRWLGVLEDIERFDCGFFGISPAEAEWMEPRQRVFLECCWSCIEDAGLNPAALFASRCGVFAGCRQGDYERPTGDEHLNAHAYLGEAAAILAARIAYFLNLKGPSLAVDTACSSSLVAVALASD